MRAQIIVSCIFAVMESFCPDDAEADESFEYLIDTTSFELPKVRFDYEVSPPPPPPASLASYELLVATDPAGFQMARAYLEDIFPRLSDVATSSVGASVGEYIADYLVTPEQLTKAYLSSTGMTKDGLGARVIESKHTGRWRPACKMLWRLFDDRKRASAGTLSKASIDGNPHFDDITHQSVYDRNLLLYAMLEIKMSLDKDALNEVEYSTIGMYDMICGSGVGGHRVPVGFMEWKTYSFQRGFELDSFSPIVGYGSLESMQSSYMAYSTACRQDFALEDVAMQIYCNGIGPTGEGKGTQLRPDALLREVYAPFAIQRDRLCNEAYDISIEDTLARPPEFDTFLYDTPYKSKFAIDQLFAAPYHRGEEKITFRRYLLSMRSFVYITSSSNPAVRPGMHRLLDLPVFDHAWCAALPGVNCAPRTSAPVILNPGDAYLASHEASQVHWTGRQMMRRIRCSSYIDAFVTEAINFGSVANEASECMRQPYVGAGTGCYTGNLNLQSRPQLYSSQQWIKTLTAPPPLPPPPPPSSPPPSPTPPHPHPPPSPPYVQPQSELMEAIRTMEEQACTSVYYLTTTTRCDRLAVGLTQSVLYEKTSPPSPPPGQPIKLSPPPPSPPPVPSLPAGIFNSPVLGSRMSTMRLPTNATSLRRKLNLYNDGYYASSVQLTTMADALRTASDDQMAQCSDWQQSAPLPCVSGAFANNCIPGMRHCGTDAENLDAPFVDLSLVSIPATRHNRLWAIQIDLPSNAELANLFYHSADAVGGSGYTVDVYRPDGSSIACMTQAEQTEAAELNSERRIMHLCAGGAASDADIYALDQAHRVRITLTGSYRQLWIKNIAVLEVASANDNLELRPPHPPPLPGMPPTPPSVPTEVCDFATHHFYSERTVVRKEPCGLTADECCYHARMASPDANAFELSDSGCCLLVHRDPGASGSMVEDTARWGYLSPIAGTGLA